MWLTVTALNLIMVKIISINIHDAELSTIIKHGDALHTNITTFMPLRL